MAPAHTVHRSRFGASSRKAQQSFGAQPMLRQCRVALWVKKIADAGCLA